MNTIIVKKKSPLTGLVAVVLILDIVRLAAIVALSFQQTLSTPIWVLCGFYAVLLVVCILLLIRMTRSQLAFQGDGMIYTPLLGQKREMSYNDIQKVYIGGKKYVMYTSDGKKFFTFDDFRTENASDIVAFLKKKGVRTEI